MYLSPSSTVTLWYVVFSTIIHLRHNRRLFADICALVLFWHCPDSMCSRVYEMERCPSVCPSVSPSMDAQQQTRKCEECHFVSVCRKLNTDIFENIIVALRLNKWFMNVPLRCQHILCHCQRRQLGWCTRGQCQS